MVMKIVNRLVLTMLVGAAIILLMVVGAAGQGSKETEQKQQRPRRVGSSTEQAPDGKSQQSGSDAGQDVDENDVVRVETRLVSVPAVVTDANGRPLPNLRAENFALFEDNAPQ